VAILGGGAVGVEFAYILSSFGVAVYLVEMLDQILPLEDHETVAVLARSFKRSGITIFTSARAASYEQKGDGLLVSLESQNAGPQIVVDRIIVSVGRKPNSSGLGLEKIGVETEAGFIKTGEHYTTSVPHISAIGDVIKTPQLAHVASAEGELAVEHIAGHATGAAIDYSLVPSAVYCEPQIAGFGVTEKKAMETGLHYAKAVFPYRGAGKSIAVEKPDGMVKIVYHRDTKEILGAHIAGTEATEVIHELLLAKKAGLRPRDIAGTIHAHPSISEAVKECAGIIENKEIYI
jgi:dihydrolipoamide dehydrogenase